MKTAKFDWQARAIQVAFVIVVIALWYYVGHSGLVSPIFLPKLPNVLDKFVGIVQSSTFYENLGITVGAVLTDNGREFCGKPESHPYELLLAVEGIKHRTTKVRSPRTNGFVERMNRTLLDECFRVQGRTKWYTVPDEIQRDLDTFMAFYNFRRTHQGYRVAGRTPAKALYDLIAEQWLLPPISAPAQEVPLAS